VRELLEQAVGQPVSRETWDRLDLYAELLLRENGRQNIISKASAEDIWGRHLIDSAQLFSFGQPGGRWLDIGSGPGLPGMVLAILGASSVTMVEPRKLRTAFLASCRDQLGLDNVEIVTGKVESIAGAFDLITARAVARLDRLFALAHRLSHPTSCWVLPKGRTAPKELEEARVNWQGDFRLEPSLTDPEARVLVARNVRPRTGRG
jgi:16S rRNA (guanine527-N7)-methyltransferase